MRVFADGFTATELDRTKWTAIGPTFWVNNEQQAYVADATSLPTP
jgi:hypothetical protein